jgi:putative CocE/NonD family hydrolase
VSSEKSYKKVHDMKVEADVGLTMSDGVRLSARVYRPAAEGKFPVLLAVSPYQHETDSIPHSTLFLWREVGPVDWYVEAQGYVIVHVDVRGTGLSQGDYHLLDKREQQDLYEMVEWCAAQPWSNGRVGGYGQSYYCWSQWFMGIMNPPGLKCIAPYDGAVDLYRDVMYHGGIYCDFLPWWYQMVRVNNLHRPPGANSGKLMAADIGRELAEHPTYDDWWRERSPWERLGEIKVPTLSIGHWGKMGLHLRGNIVGYEEIDAPKKLVVTGARDVFEAHDQFEQIDYHEAELLPFYDQHLKGKQTGAMDGAPVRLFVRGTNVMREEKEWPPARAQYKPLYLNGAASGSVRSLNDGGLSWDAPEKGVAPTEYNYPDPKWKLGVVGMGPQGPDSVGRVLTFTTEPFAEDTEMTGRAVLELYLSSTTIDTDVFVKLSDQLPQSEEDRAKGLQPQFLIISKGWLRASHREKDEALSTATRPFYKHQDPRPLTPGEVVKLDIEILPFSNLFRKGHRLRLELANGDSPLTDSIFTHQYSWFKVGRDLIHHDAGHPSRLLLPVIPA